MATRKILDDKGDKVYIKRKMKESDIPIILEKVFHDVDSDKNNRFSK